MSISTTEIKSIFEMNREELSEYNQSKLLEFKELFLTTDLPVDEIYTKINVDKNDPTYRYIQSQRGKNGLSAKNRDVNFNIVESSTYNDFEEIYQRFKKIWLENPNISKKQAFKEMGENQTHSRMKYINERMGEDGLQEHYYGGKQGRKKTTAENILEKSDYESKYQEYKNLFETTDIPLKEIREQLCISDNTNNPLRKYIIERCKEDGLDGRKRNINQQRKKNPRVKKAKKKPKSKKEKKVTVSRKYESLYSKKAHQIIKNSKPLLEKMYAERNVSKSTQKGYEAAFIKYCEFTKDKFSSLQEMIDTYLDEEDKRIPMRERSLKKDLLGFRESLHNKQNNNGVKSDRSLKTYFAKVKTIFNHFELEMPTLPQMKMEKGYISNYNDLPTHDMIRNACDQSPIELKALILFMSSSGSAKAETLSVTVGMFLEGCKDYLEDTPSGKNIEQSIKVLSDRHDIVPMIYLRRIKTDKWYYTYCSPEASYIIVESLKIRKNLKWEDKLFDFTSSLLLTRFQEINDNNNWGCVGSYRRFRSHALRKFMASNIGLSRDITDSIQGRSKDMIQEAYFKQDPQALKKTYMEVMHRVMVYENWGHGTTLDEMERQKKRLSNDFKDDEKIIDLSVIPETPDEIKTSIGLETDTETTASVDRSTINVKQNKGNSLPITAPHVVPAGHVRGVSVSKELLNYAELMEKGLLSIAEFNRVKQKLLMGVLR